MAFYDKCHWNVFTLLLLPLSLVLHIHAKLQLYSYIMCPLHLLLEFSWGKNTYMCMMQKLCSHNYVLLQTVVILKSYDHPFTVADISFLPLAAPYLNDVTEGDGFVIVSIVLGGATLTSALEVTVQTIPGGSATGNTVFDM